jgi:hypothetical protein
MKIILTLCTLAICGATTLRAADAPKKPGAGGDKPKMSAEEVFKKLDANGDGKLTKEEYLAGPRAKQDPAKAEERWKAMSKGKDSITLEEFKAAGPGKGGKGGDKGGKKPEAK